jgi:hypothetical protein
LAISRKKAGAALRKNLAVSGARLICREKAVAVLTLL